MSRFALFVRFLSVAVLAALPVTLCGCPGGGGGGDRFISIGTARQGGAFYQVGAAIANALNAGAKTGGWEKATAEVSGGTLANLRRLESSEIEIGMANSSISYLAVKGEGFDKKYNVKSIMTLFPLIAMFVTKSDSGIKSIKDLKGKRVIIGPQGAGFEHFVRPILEAHGVNWDEIDVQYASFSDSVGYLQDGTAAAAFLGGGMKSPAITSAATSMSIVLVPYEEKARQELIRKFPSFSAVVVKAKTYKGVDEDFAGLNVGSAQLLVRADASDDFVRNVVKVIWEQRKTIAETHAGGKSINENNVARNVGVEFHPAASKFYKDELKIGGGSSSGESKSH
ncbi:MAG: TAXI family TRAP transporter solute-binding subunit [Planctomycetaceae bacterium]